MRHSVLRERARPPKRRMAQALSLLCIFALALSLLPLRVQAAGTHSLTITKTVANPGAVANPYEGFTFRLSLTQPVPPVTPTVTNGSITGIGYNRATMTNSSYADFPDDPIEVGVQYSTVNPIADTTPKTAAGSVSNPFSVQMTGLSMNTIYFVRSYAVASDGTTYYATTMPFRTPTQARAPIALPLPDGGWARTGEGAAEQKESRTPATPNKISGGHMRLLADPVYQPVDMPAGAYAALQSAGIQIQHSSTGVYTFVLTAGQSITISDLADDILFSIEETGGIVGGAPVALADAAARSRTTLNGTAAAYPTVSGNLQSDAAVVFTYTFPTPKPPPASSSTPPTPPPVVVSSSSSSSRRPASSGSAASSSSTSAGSAASSSAVPSSSGNPPADSAPPQLPPEDPSVPPPATKEEIRIAAVNEIRGAGIPVMTLGNTQIPLFSLPHIESWALLSLILATLGLLFALVVIVVTLRRRKNGQGAEETAQDAAATGDAAAGAQKKRRSIAPVATVILGVLGMALFFITAHLNGLMVLADAWTAVLAVLFAVQVVCGSSALARRHKQTDGEESA